MRTTEGDGAERVICPLCNLDQTCPTQHLGGCSEGELFCLLVKTQTASARCTQHKRLFIHNDTKHPLHYVDCVTDADPSGDAAGQYPLLEAVFNWEGPP